MPYELPDLPIRGLESRNGWSKFPLCRPLIKPVAVIVSGTVKKGAGCYCQHSGCAIRVDGTLINSNHEVWWKYVSE